MKKIQITITLTGLFWCGILQNVVSQNGYNPQQIEAMENAKKAALDDLKKQQNQNKNAQPEQDCSNALTICQDVYYQLESYVGTGNIPNEINPALSCLDAGEVNNVWYILTAQNSGTLSFTITPVNPADDYDWAVYNITDASCYAIFYDPALQTACNFSAIPGATGANGNTAGNPQNTNTISVTQGQTFVINVSNFSASQSGYTLDFSASSVTLYDTIPPLATGAEHVCNNYGVRITTNEQITCNTIAADGSDFSATGSSGTPVPVVGAVGVGCSSNNLYTNQIDIVLASQSQAQTISVGLQTGTDGNTLGDKCLNWMESLNQSAVVQPKPVLTLGDDLLLCFFGLSYPLLKTTGDWATFQWYRNTLPIPGADAATYQTSSTGIYSVVANNLQTADPCIYSDTVVVDVSLDYCAENLPNAFSPNGDGVNDLYLSGANMIIVNRWGQTLFEGSQGWDGTHNGMPVSNGTYYVIFKYTDTQGLEHLVKEPVTLIR
jgi:gliding motility-associated-like protein